MPNPPVDRPLVADPSSALARVSGIASLPRRLDLLSEGFLGAPYTVAPLIGSASTPEQLVIRLDAFDCVTYAETVLALAWSEAEEDLPGTLAALRYRDGRVAYHERNHYMVTWLERNGADGWLTPVAERAWVAAPEAPRVLSVLRDHPTREWHARYLPVGRWPELSAEVSPGDLVCFVSPRPDLDVFHVGLLFPALDGPRLRHASRAAGYVVEQPLSAYLDGRPECPGMLVARPLPRSRRS